MIEAMACGTPVLAFRCGSVPEIVDEGITGAIVDTMEEAIAALPRVMALAAAFRATLFRHADGKGLRRRLSFAAQVVEIRRPPAKQDPTVK
jgi:glycosyltransferase involved in cell wall biosynthesis